MFPIRDDGRFSLPLGAAQDFTRFLEQNGIAYVGVGQLRTPFDSEKIQTLYLQWVNRHQRRIRRSMLIIPLAVTVSVFVMYFAGCNSDESGPGQTPPLLASPVPPSVDRILATLTLGNIAYNTPSSMRVDDDTEIHLRLSPRATIEELKAKVGGLGEKVGALIRVANVMEADLYSDAFEIVVRAPRVRRSVRPRIPNGVGRLRQRNRGNRNLGSAFRLC